MREALRRLLGQQQEEEEEEEEEQHQGAARGGGERESQKPFLLFLTLAAPTDLFVFLTLGLFNLFYGRVFALLSVRWVTGTDYLRFAVFIYQLYLVYDSLYGLPHP